MKMENKQEVFEALEELSKQPQDGPINPILDQYLGKIAISGVTWFPWSKLKPLIARKMNMVIEKFQKDFPVENETTCPNVEIVSFDDMKKRLQSNLDSFNGIPFTIQRLCELLTGEAVVNQYKRVDKFMRGVEKNLIVVTTVDPFGNRVVGENKPSPNGASSDISLDDDSLVTSLTGTSACKPTSWFSSLTSVVDSPDSYPNWKHPQEEQQHLDGVTSSSSQDRKTDDDDECLPPPSKIFRPSDDFAVDKTDVKDDSSFGQSSGFTPLLTQLLNGSASSLATLQKVEESIPEDSCGAVEHADPADGFLDIFSDEEQPKQPDDSCKNDLNENLTVERQQRIAATTGSDEKEAAVCCVGGFESNEVEMKEDLGCQGDDGGRDSSSIKQKSGEEDVGDSAKAFHDYEVQIDENLVDPEAAVDSNHEQQTEKEEVATLVEENVKSVRDRIPVEMETN